MTTPADAITEANFIDAPRDEFVRALYEHWRELRGDRAMPARADLDPTRIPKLLPYIIMYNVVGGDDRYTIRLQGEEVQRFVGRNTTGNVAGAIMPPRSVEVIRQILDAVVAERVPKFRAGTAHWYEERRYRAFEACFLPLSSDGTSVDIVLCAVRFPP